MHTNTSSKHHKYMCMYQAYSQCGHHWINGHCGEAVESPALPNSQGPCTHQSSLSDYWIASLWPPQKPPFYPAAAEVWASWLPWGEGSHTRKLKAQGMHELTHTHTHTSMGYWLPHTMSKGPYYESINSLRARDMHTASVIRHLFSPPKSVNSVKFLKLGHLVT